MVQPKLILSRKGFDSDSGAYSPFESKTGKYIWFPIPQKKVERYNNKIQYRDIQIQSYYLSGYKDTNLSSLYRSLHNQKAEITLKKKPKKETKEIDSDELFAHYDPMLGPGPRLTAEQPITIGWGFGQNQMRLAIC